MSLKGPLPRKLNCLWNGVLWAVTGKMALGRGASSNVVRHVEWKFWSGWVQCRRVCVIMFGPTQKPKCNTKGIGLCQHWLSICLRADHEYTKCIHTGQVACYVGTLFGRCQVALMGKQQLQVCWINSRGKPTWSGPPAFGAGLKALGLSRWTRYIHRRDSIHGKNVLD